jgi:hypothetical protein
MFLTTPPVFNKHEVLTFLFHTLHITLIDENFKNKKYEINEKLGETVG